MWINSREYSILNRPDAPPLSMAMASLAAYAGSDADSISTAADNANLYQGNNVAVDKAIIHEISSIVVIVALIHCRQHHKELVRPHLEKSFVDNVLLTIGFVDEASKFPDSKVVRKLDRLWVLYCDHEMTNSTAAFLHATSTLADSISCCTAYIASGNGLLHAGTIDLAYKAFARLKTPDKVAAMIADVRAKKYRLFGYGHRIYKTIDPRAKFVRVMLDDSSRELIVMHCLQWRSRSIESPSKTHVHVAQSESEC